MYDTYVEVADLARLKQKLITKNHLRPEFNEPQSIQNRERHEPIAYPYFDRDEETGKAVIFNGDGTFTPASWNEFGDEDI